MLGEPWIRPACGIKCENFLIKNLSQLEVPEI
jgi:hypothetical protein